MVVERKALRLTLSLQCLTDPAALNHILLTHSYDYPKPDQVRGEIAKILGKGILFAEGDVHRHQKRMSARSWLTCVATDPPRRCHGSSVRRTFVCRVCVILSTVALQIRSSTGQRIDANF